MVLVLYIIYYYSHDVMCKTDFLALYAYVFYMLFLENSNTLYGAFVL
jgi:hypothetical protein